MKKTKIGFDEIKAGDLIEVVGKADGVKYVTTGIAFEFEDDYISGYGAWFTSEVGLLAVDGDTDEFYRIDVREVSFDDIRAGDRIRVITTFPNGRIETREDTVSQRIEGMNPFWVNGEPDSVIFKRVYEGDGTTRTIEILEREGEK